MLIGEHQVNMEDAEHSGGTPYSDLVRDFADLSRGGFTPSDIVDRYGAEPEADSACVSWMAEGRAVRVAFQQNIGDNYDHDAVGAIVRAANTAARGGRFRYAPRQYAYVWLPEGAEPILTAEGLVFEVP